MEYQDINLLLKLPTLQLLRAQNAPMLLGFLHVTFKREHKVAIPEGGKVENVPVRCRIDTPIEIDYYQNGGILPYVLRQLAIKA